MEVIGYARISTKDQSTYSIPGQVKGITEYCTRNNLTLHRVFVDDGQSAFNFNRKEWKELEAYLRSHPQVKAIVVMALDRFSRANLADALAKMDQIQRRLGVKILTVTDAADLDIDDFGTDLKRIVELLFSNYELKKIRKRTSEGMYNAMLQGRYVNKAPIGYLNARDTEAKPILRIDPVRGPQVQQIFSLFLQGVSMAEIDSKVKVRQGNSAIKRILVNPVYAGLLQLPKRGGHAAKIVKGLHPALISESDYWSVQQMLGDRTRKSQHREDVHLSGVLRCHKCGGVMSTDKSRGKSGRHYRYYICKRDKVRLPAEKLHTVIRAVLAELSIPAESLKIIKEGLQARITERMKDKGGDLMRANQALQSVQRRIAATEEKYLLQPDISAAVYKKVIGEMRSEEALLMQQIGQLRGSEKGYMDMIDLLIPKLANVSELFNAWPLYKQQAFIKLVFGGWLSFHDGAYRTPTLHRLFADKERVLKQKGLLYVESVPFVAPAGVQPNTLFDDIMSLWKAVG